MRMEEGVQVWAAWAGMVSPTSRFFAAFRDPSIAQAFERVLDDSRPELVHVQHLMGLPIGLIRSIQQRRIPFVITLWDFWWVCANAQLLTNYSQQVCDGPQLYLNCARCALARVNYDWFWPAAVPAVALLAWRNRVLRQVMKAASRLIAPTAFVHHWYAKHNVPTDRLQVIQPGLENLCVSSQLEERSDGRVRFAYIGGLSRQKGIHVLVQAFGGVRGTAELWIAGDEAFDPGYVAELRDQAVPAVRFLGRLTREDVWKTLAQVDAVVVPSLWYETFSFAVSEAFAAGKPVVASRLGPLADRVRHGVDGLLLNPGDVCAWQEALQRLVNEPDLLAHLRSNVRPPVTLDEHVAEIKSLYANLIDGESGA